MQNRIKILQRLVGPAIWQKLSTLPSFNVLPLSPEAIQYLHSNDLHTPSPIQDKAIQKLMESSKMLFYLGAQNGTGKTLAYLLPVFEKLKILDNQTRATAVKVENKRNRGKNELLQEKTQIQQAIKTNHKDVDLSLRRPKAIILLPNILLKNQTYSIAKSISHYIRLRVREKITDENQDVMVMRISELMGALSEHRLFLNKLHYLVVDEVDMVSETVNEKLRLLLKNLAARKVKIIFVSATYNTFVDKFLKDIASKEEIKYIVDWNMHKSLQNIKHEFKHCSTFDKNKPLLSALRSILMLPIITSESIQQMNNSSQEKGAVNNQEQVNKAFHHKIIIFCNSISATRSVANLLTESGMECLLLHGDISKAVREQNIELFRNGHVKILISTDLGSRGLDFPDVTHIINFDFPSTVADYLHRSGRTGRAGRKGCIISLYHNKDKAMINHLQAAAKGDKHLQIGGSQYQCINREVLRSLRKSTDGDLAYKEQKKLLQIEINTQNRQNEWLPQIFQQEVKHTASKFGYVREKSRTRVLIRTKRRQLSKMGKRRRNQAQNLVRQVKSQIRHLHRQAGKEKVKA